MPKTDADLYEEARASVGLAPKLPNPIEIGAMSAGGAAIAISIFAAVAGVDLERAGMATLLTMVVFFAAPYFYLRNEAGKHDTRILRMYRSLEGLTGGSASQTRLAVSTGHPLPMSLKRFLTFERHVIAQARIGVLGEAHLQRLPRLSYRYVTPLIVVAA
jgi:hypothetical protein